MVYQPSTYLFLLKGLKMVTINNLSFNVNIKLVLNIPPFKSFDKTNDGMRSSHVNERSPNNQLSYLTGLVVERLSEFHERRYTPVV